MINIDVFSDEKAWSKKIRKKEHFFKNICKFFPKKYQFPNKKVNFTLLLSNNKGTKKLNKEFRNKNKSTDVLSFPFSKQTKISKITYIGDIIISYNFMDKPKSQNLKSFKEKINCFNDLNSIINNDSIDAIYIPLSNEEHTKIALEAIKNKKHVLIEKQREETLSLPTIVQRY